MQTFAERSERHSNVLEVLCEHMATVVDGAFHRVLKAELPEEKDQAALVFDRLARGLRLTVAAETRLHRDMARDTREIERLAVERAAVSVEAPSQTHRAARTPTPYIETDHESEADYESGDTSLDIHLKTLDALLDAPPEVPDRSNDWWVKSQNAANPKPKRHRRRKAYPGDDPGPQGPPPLDATLRAMAAPGLTWRGSG